MTEVTKSAKQYLTQIARIDLLIEQKRAEQGVEQRVDTRLDREIRELAEERASIIDRIQSLEDPKQIEILYKRYVERKSLSIIAEEMGLKYSYVSKLHGAGLKKLK